MGGIFRSKRMFRVGSMGSKAGQGRTAIDMGVNAGAVFVRDGRAYHDRAQHDNW